MQLSLHSQECKVGDFIPYYTLVSIIIKYIRKPYLAMFGIKIIKIENALVPNYIVFHIVGTLALLVGRQISKRGVVSSSLTVGKTFSFLFLMIYVLYHQFVLYILLQ